MSFCEEMLPGKGAVLGECLAQVCCLMLFCSDDVYTKYLGLT